MSPTATELGLVGCSTCNLVTRVPEESADYTCPRCGTALHRRKPDSLSKTWAYLIAACILYFPANILPIAQTTSLGQTRYDNILDGVIFLWEEGSYALSAIVFIASFIVPLSKLVAMLILVISVQRKSTWHPRQRTRLYRMVELIGKWSMLDIFVAALMSTLVNFGSLMEIRVDYGAVAFGAVVVLTMMAVHSFDTRFIWDPVVNPVQTPFTPKSLINYD